MQTAVIESVLGESETLQALPAGTTLFREGEEPRGVYALRSGEADVLFSTRDGNTKPIRVAGAGQILGLSAVVMHQPHECSAIARTRCEIGFIDRETFIRALEEKPSVWFNVLRVLSSDVNAAYDEMRTLVRR